MIWHNTSDQTFGFLLTQNKSNKVRSTTNKLLIKKAIKRNITWWNDCTLLYEWTKDNYVRATPTKRVKEWYWHWWYYKETQTVDHQVVQWRCQLFLFSVLMNSRCTTFSSTKSRMKWYRISICFDFECCTGFFNRLMVFVLSQKMHMVSWEIP